MIIKKNPIFQYTNKYFSVYQQEIEIGSFIKEYYVADFGGKAGILIIADENILLVRQYRLLPDKYSWEIPGGKIEKNENPKESAIRECREETGIECQNLNLLINYKVGLDAIDADASLFYTNDFQVVHEFKPNPQEVDMMRWISFTECLNMIKSGEIIDHFTIVAIFYYHTFIKT